MPNQIQIYSGDQTFKQQVMKAFQTLPTSWLTASFAYTITALGSGAVTSIMTTALSGAVPGAGQMVLPPQFSVDTKGLNAYGWIGSTGNVSFIWHNPTAGSISAIAGTVYLAVLTP
jgi:hypothetical protein